jgi:hypothetical protein
MFTILLPEMSAVRPETSKGRYLKQNNQKLLPRLLVQIEIQSSRPFYCCTTYKAGISLQTKNQLKLSSSFNFFTALKKRSQFGALKRLRPFKSIHVLFGPLTASNITFQRPRIVLVNSSPIGTKLFKKQPFINFLKETNFRNNVFLKSEASNGLKGRDLEAFENIW